MAITDNLIAYWKLQEASGSRADSYGSETLTDNGSHGRVTGLGNIPYAVSVTDNVALSKSSDAALENTGNFSVCGWFKLTSLGAGKYPTPIFKYNSGSAALEWTIAVNGDNMNWACATTPDGSNLTWVSSPNNSITNGTWYFVVFWYDGVNLNLSLNDGTVYQTAYSSGVYSGTGPLWLSWSMSGTECATAGVAFWKRALTSAERSWLYNSGNGLADYLANTAPTITAGPTTTYAVGSDTRPGNTWGVTFTAWDAQQTGADALTYYLRTSSTWGAGTQVATGTCTSGTSKVVTGLLYNASGLVNGSQTLYLHIYDGTDHTASASSFSLLVLMAPLTLSTIAGQSAITGAVDAPNPYVLPSTIVGQSSVAATLSTPGYLAPSNIAGQGGVSGILSTPGYLALGVIAGQSAVSAVISAPAPLTLSAIVGASSLSALLSTPALLTLSQIAAQSGVTVTLTVLLPPGEMGLRVDAYAADGTKLGFGPITSALACSYRLALDQVGSFTLDIPAEEERASYVTVGCQLWFYWASEGLVFRGMVDRKQSVVDAEGKTVLRITGSSLARQLVNLNTLLGMAFNGSTLSAAVGSNASANTLLYQTGWAAGALDVPGTTLLARFDGLSRWEALAKAAQQFKLHVREDHITLSGGNPVRNVDVGAFGASSGIVFKNVDSVSPNLRQNTALYPIAGLTVLEDGNDLWNSIIPVGAGEGINQLTLKYSDRSSPYTIQTATGPDGLTYYYLEDSTSVTAYGRRQRVVSIKDAAPLALSAAGMKAAANALYDQAVTYLTRYKDPPSTYEVEVVGLKHVSSGTPLFHVGDKVRLLYHGVAHDRTGDRAWLTVDANVWITDFSRTFSETGADAWKLTVSTVDRLVEDDAAKIGQVFQNVFALSVAMKPYTFTTKAGPQRGSLDSGTSKALTLTVTFDANVGMLHKAKLRWQATALRSNVSVAAAGGAQTSSSGGGATTSAGGAQTSSSQSDHTHSVSGQSTSSNSGHRHRMFQYQSSDSLNTDVPSNNTSDAFTGNSAYESAAGDPHYHGLSNHTHQMAQHTHNIPDFRLMYGKASDGTTNVWVRISEYATYQDIYTFDSDTSHTHNISTATSAAGGSHSHTVSDHTHTVSAHTHTVADHTHGLTYGVVEDTTPTNPQLSVAINGVDRTAAFTAQLGSAAWRDAMNSWQTVDVSSWLSDANGIVLQQNNTITFTVGKASTHLDIEAEVESLVTATSLVPV